MDKIYSGSQEHEQETYDLPIQLVYNRKIEQPKFILSQLSDQP